MPTGMQSNEPHVVDTPRLDAYNRAADARWNLLVRNIKARASRQMSYLMRAIRRLRQRRASYEAIQRLWTRYNHFRWVYNFADVVVYNQMVGESFRYF
jgi:hypothetical protein